MMDNFFHKETILINESEKFLEIHKDLPLDFKYSYKSLLDGYKKLSKRFAKIIKINDSIGNNLFAEHESFKEKSTKFAKDSRDKLLSQIAANTKFKQDVADTTNQYQTIIENLKTMILTKDDELQQAIKKINQLNSLIKILKTNQREDNDINTKVDFTTLLNHEFYEANKNNHSFVLIKIVIEDYNKILSELEHIMSGESFIANVLKKLSHSLKKHDIVHYTQNGEFFIILQNTKLEQVKHLIEKITEQSALGHTRISFAVGALEYYDNNFTPNTILDEVASFLNNAKKMTGKKIFYKGIE